MKRRNAILNILGMQLPTDAHILDFGCGAGRTVYSLINQGYPNVYGYDVDDYLEIRRPEDRTRFFIADHAGGGGAVCLSRMTASISLSQSRCWST